MASVGDHKDRDRTHVDRIWEELWKHVCELHYRWDVYCSLFGKDERRIALLNRWAPSVFRLLQDVLLDSIVLSLSRLTDGRKSGRKSNCSLEQLTDALGAREHANIKASLEESLRALEERIKPLRDLRNTQLAHTDLEHALTSDGIEALGFSRQDIANVLDQLRRFMNAFDQHFHDTTTVFEQVTPQDAEGLVMALKMASAYRELENARKVPRNSWRRGPLGDV